MNDDLLRQMTSALSEEYDGVTAVPEATRARVVRALAERRPRRRKWVVIGVPFFVVFGGSTAWAAATGRLPEVVQQAASFITGQASDDEEVAEAAPKKPTSRAPQGLAQRPSEQPAIEEPSTEDSSEPDERAPEPEASAPPPETKPAPRVAAPASLPATAEPEEPDSPLLTYRAAHRAHFRDGNCRQAIDGYRAYLREKPNGTFAIEARYNQAVCLVREGRSSEAEALLEPFAQGQYGNYRRKSAAELLDALDAR